MHSISDGLLDAVYEAALDDEAYVALSGRIAAEMNGCSALFQEHHRGRVTIRSAYGFNFESLADYTAHFAQSDPWVQAGLRAPLNTGVALDRYVPQSVFERTELYADYLRRHSDILHCLGLIMPFEGGRTTVVAVHHARGQGGFDAEHERWFQTLQPHLGRMMRTRWRAAEVAERARLPERVLDQHVDAVFCVDRRSALRYANETALALLEEPGPFVRWRGDGLQLRARADNARLQRALADATHAGKPVSAVFSLERTARLPLHITVDPYQPHDPAQPLAVVVVRDAEVHSERVSAVAARLFGFTRAEAALARALVQGSSPDDYALARGVSIHTVRTQVRALLAKTGAARVAELVGRLLALPPG